MARRPAGLLHSLGLPVGTDECVEDGQHMTAVIHHAGKNVVELRVAFRFAVPFGKHSGGNLNIPPQLVGGMPAQKEAIEKCCFALGEIEIV